VWADGVRGVSPPTLLEVSHMYSCILSEHIAWCSRDGQIVLLDLKSDQYLSLNDRAGAAFLCLLGYEDATYLTEKPARDELRRAAREFVFRGIFTQKSFEGKFGRRSQAIPPQREINADSIGLAPALNLSSVLAFWSAACRAAIALRCLPISRVVQLVRQRRPEEIASPSEPVIAELENSVATFARLRPWAFSSRDACLFEALAMLQFLAGSRIYPSWVFGVQVAPFCAHCWVQLGDLVIDDTVEHVRGYTPIMVV
jgi:hypothetical protein